MIKQRLSHAVEPSAQQMMADAELLEYSQNWEALIVRNDLLFRKFFHCEGNVEKLQLLIPRAMRTDLLNRIHCFELGHLRSWTKMTAAVLDIAFFPGWKTAACICLSSCVQCAKSGARHEPRTGKIITRKHLYECGHTVFADMKENIQSVHSKHHFILVLVDGFSRYTSLFPLLDKSGRSVADALLVYFLRFGPPRILHTENGSSIKYGEVEELCKLFSVPLEAKHVQAR
jgi:hypothetical protein